MDFFKDIRKKGAVPLTEKKKMTEAIQILCDIVRAAGVPDAAHLPLSACRMTRSYLADRLPFRAQSVCIGILPYCTEAALNDPCRNVSVYAAPQDYHIYIRELGERILTEAARTFPEAHFAVFGDHSPIDEIHAAAAAGLGILGDNGLLITERYSSFVFLFEILTDLPSDAAGREVRRCEHCGRCGEICPAGRNPELCLSALSQKKGTLTGSEAALLRNNRTVWGCDLCQTVCPHTEAARKSGTLFTQISFFRTNIITQITPETIENTADFSRRAYSWRKKETVLRNLQLQNPKDKS